ncbi:MAG: hypothetical protein LBN19_01595 [Endomicrobium sp.]|jgi:hypothetical protein|nr:hypothetical protein [Endomicrobium sp.]
MACSFESSYLLNFKRLQNIDIIVNGIITTLKHYLRFIDSYDDFLKSYTKKFDKRC